MLKPSPDQLKVLYTAIGTTLADIASYLPPDVTNIEQDVMASFNEAATALGGKQASPVQTILDALSIVNALAQISGNQNLIKTVADLTVAVQDATEDKWLALIPVLVKLFNDLKADFKK